MKSDIDLFVINRIREKRKELKVSQRGMAEILGCSAGFIGQVESENSDTKYSVHQLYLIAKDFDCSPADFFGCFFHITFIWKKITATLL